MDGFYDCIIRGLNWGTYWMNKNEWNTLVRAAVNQDSEAFDAIVRAKMKTILYYTTKFVYPPAFAEDAAQEVVLQMYKSIGSLQAPEAFNVWMHRIILGVCSDMNRKFVVTTPIDELEEVPVETKIPMLPQEATEEDEQRRRILEAVNELPTRQRVAITMFYYDGMSYKEIALVLGITVPGVSSTIVRAKKALKMKLSKQEGLLKEEHLLNGMVFAPALFSAFQAEADMLVSSAKLAELSNQTLGALSVQAKAGRLVKIDFSLKKWMLFTATAVVSSAVLASGIAFYKAPKKEIQASIVMENVVSQQADQINPASIHLELANAKGWSATWVIENAQKQTVAHGEGFAIGEEELLTLATGSYEAVWTLEQKGNKFYVSRAFEII